MEVLILDNLKPFRMNTDEKEGAEEPTLHNFGAV